MTKPIDTSRREFLRNASLLSLAGTVGAPFALNLFAMNVAAASTFTADYKALVCLYLAGGNDSANMVIATDTPSWDDLPGCTRRLHCAAAGKPAAHRPDHHQGGCSRYAFLRLASRHGTAADPVQCRTRRHRRQCRHVDRTDRG